MATITYSVSETTAIQQTATMLLSALGQPEQARKMRYASVKNLCEACGNGSNYDLETGVVTLIVPEKQMLAVLQATQDSIDDVSPILIAGYQLFIAFKAVGKRIEQRFTKALK